MGNQSQGRPHTQPKGRLWQPGGGLQEALAADVPTSHLQDGTFPPPPFALKQWRGLQKDLFFGSEVILESPLSQHPDLSSTFPSQPGCFWAWHMDTH